MTFVVNGGLVSEIRLFAETWTDYLFLEVGNGTAKQGKNSPVDCF